MSVLGILILVTGPILAIAWIYSEFNGSKRLRLTLGILVIIVFTAVSSLVTLIINQLNYNAWYGFATKELVDQIIKGLEANKTDSVLLELKRFQSEYYPTYENRAKYVPLAKGTAERIKDKVLKKSFTERPPPSGHPFRFAGKVVSCNPTSSRPIHMWTVSILVDSIGTQQTDAKKGEVKEIKCHSPTEHFGIYGDDLVGKYYEIPDGPKDMPWSWCARELK